MTGADVKKITRLGLMLGVLAGCSVPDHGSQLYGQRDPTIQQYPLNGRYGPMLNPLEQAQGFFTNPYEWPADYDKYLTP